MGTNFGIFETAKDAEVAEDTEDAEIAEDVEDTEDAEIVSNSHILDNTPQYWSKLTWPNIRVRNLGKNVFLLVKSVYQRYRQE